MCLDTVTSEGKEKLPRGEYRIGWKAVSIAQPISPQRKSKTFHSIYNDSKPLNKWLKCEHDLQLWTDLYPSTSYPSGFHIFETRAGARFWSYGVTKVVKVRYRQVVARGTQDDFKCVITKEMYVEGPTAPKKVITKGKKKCV